MLLHGAQLGAMALLKGPNAVVATHRRGSRAPRSRPYLDARPAVHLAQVQAPHVVQRHVGARDLRHTDLDSYMKTDGAHAQLIHVRVRNETHIVLQKHKASLNYAGLGQHAAE